MSKFLDKLAAGLDNYRQYSKPALDYIMQGDEAALARLMKQLKNTYFTKWWLNDVYDHLPLPQEHTDIEKRAMKFAVAQGTPKLLAQWMINKTLEHPTQGPAVLAAYRGAFPDSPEGQVMAAVAMVDVKDCLDVASTSVQEAIDSCVLALSAEQLQQACLACEEERSYPQLLSLLLRRAPERVPPLAEMFLLRKTEHGPYLDDDVCRMLLEHDPGRYEQQVSEAFRNFGHAGPKFRAGVELARFNRDKYHQAVRSAAGKVLSQKNWQGISDLAATWLLDQYQDGALEELNTYFQCTQNDYMAVQVLQLTVERLQRGARPAVRAATENTEATMRIAALQYLLEWRDPDDEQVIHKAIDAGLKNEDGATAIRFLPLAARFDVVAVEESLWAMLDHKSKPARSAAARTLAKLGDSVVPRCAEMMQEKKAVRRGSAVAVLAAVQSDAATAALESRLDDETDEEIRDQMLLGVESAWEAAGRKITKKETAQRVERTESKLKTPVAKWLDESKLPPLLYADDQQPLDPTTVRYLLYRQSRAKEMRADVEAKALLSLLDRRSAAAFAAAVLQAFCGGPADAGDRWVLALAGTLGDDRVVPIILQQIKKWVDSKRGKMAEYAAQALALVGTDVALCAVDSLAIRYRTKQKNIGKAAEEAFAEAADRLNITVDELGDRVVPWLGFEPDQPRMIEAGDKRIEVRIDQDFKLCYRDLEKNKPIKSLPSAVPADIKKEFKDLAATLREVVKGQVVRVENLMVRQFRWPIERWRELFLKHPLLLPFAMRLVWGCYDADGRLQTIFRTLEDRTQTNENDDSVELPTADGTTIGVVHPLELTAEQRQAWVSHLSDYKVSPPFLQLERAVVCPNDDEKRLRLSDKYDGQELNAMTFRGRAEKRGWQRGSVVDAGGITCYRKCFPGAGADVILLLDGMYIGIDMYSDIKLMKFGFVRSGSVTFGSYTYDEPENEKDQRLIAFGDVPAIVYSEVMGDLQAIAGAKSEDVE